MRFFGSRLNACEASTNAMNQNLNEMLDMKSAKVTDSPKTLMKYSPVWHRQISSETFDVLGIIKYIFSINRYFVIFKHHPFNRTVCSIFFSFQSAVQILPLWRHLLV